MHDSQAARTEFALDLVLPFCAAGESSHIQALKIKNSANSVTATKVQLSFLDWQSDFGGSTCYVANEEDEEVGADLSIKCRCVHNISINADRISFSSQLLTVYPEDNSLALVYRDKETLKFVKHINHKSCSDSTNIRAFYDFSFVYFE